jgi:hypothetical protein
MTRPWLTLRRLAIALPAVFLLHVAEEAPGFVAWFNAHVDPDITDREFRWVTGSGLVITLILATLVAVSRERVLAIAATGWIGFLMLANGIFHVVATVMDGAYAPGFATALLLYLPVSLLWIAVAARELPMRLPAVVAIALIGGIPMYVHGYRIVFEGSRLI